MVYAPIAKTIIIYHTISVRCCRPFYLFGGATLWWFYVVMENCLFINDKAHDLTITNGNFPVNR